MTEKQRQGVKPQDLPADYYNLNEYVTKERMLTFWYQLAEVLSCAPESILEVGVGSRIVAGALRERGVKVATADINPALEPTVVCSVQELDKHFLPDEFDLILCARVLHHVPFDEVEDCLQQLSVVSKSHVILTLPVDDLRLYFQSRITSGASNTSSLRIPSGVKRTLLRVFRTRLALDYSRLWKINSSPATSLANIETLLKRYYVIDRSFAIPEDRSHHMFVLRKAAIAKEV